jgi:hypothetical protein
MSETQPLPEDLHLHFPSKARGTGRHSTVGQDANSSRSALASFRSSVSKPSVNQP